MMPHLNYALVTLSALLLAACGSQASINIVEPPTTELSVIAECQANLDELRRSTAALTSTSEKDRAGLVGKLDGAIKALSAGKNADAVQKLNDYVNKVVSLQAQGKISPAEAAPLLSGAEASITCINGISVPA
jgi:hypothetical protein